MSSYFIHKLKSLLQKLLPLLSTLNSVSTIAFPFFFIQLYFEYFVVILKRDEEK